MMKYGLQLQIQKVKRSIRLEQQRDSSNDSLMGTADKGKPLLGPTQQMGI